MVNHYVYVIKEKGSRRAPVKIGVAVDIEERMAELQIGNPRELSILIRLGPMTREVAFELETSMHHRFAKHCLRGEWFDGRVVEWLTDKPPAYRQRQEQTSPMFSNRGV